MAAGGASRRGKVRVTSLLRPALAPAVPAMAEPTDWSLPPSLQPQPGEVAFDLAAALGAVVMLKAEIPEDAFTAPILGTERVGNGVVIRDDGLILTIGYLITEAESIWITANDGSVVPGHPLAYDYASGLGLVLPLGRLRVPPLARGSIDGIDVGDDVIVAGRGGRTHALKAQVFAKREFAGYWEYVLDEALFTTPPHPEWSGAALVDDAGRLVGIGSLFVQEEFDGETVKGNMFVPVDLLAPILDALLASGRPPGAPRGWLGMYTVEDKGRLVVTGLADTGPAARAGVRPGDVVVEVAGERIDGLAALFRAVWRQGPAGTTVKLTLARDGAMIGLDVRLADRNDYLKKPRLQ
jgi:S1-C subfamily serine protease